MKLIVLTLASLALGVLLIGISWEIHDTSEFAVPLMIIGFVIAIGGASSLLFRLFVSTN